MKNCSALSGRLRLVFASVLLWAGVLLFFAPAQAGDIGGVSLARMQDITTTRVQNLAALATERGRAGRVVYLSGRTSAGDGGQGFFVWSSADQSAAVTADPRQGLTVAPTIAPTGASGAWLRQVSGSVDVRWFGAIGNGVADDTAAIQAAVNSGRKGVHLPAGDWSFSQLTLSVGGQELTLASGAKLKPTVWNQNAVIVTAANVTISGGEIASLGFWDGANTAWTYAVIYITGANCTVRDVTLTNVPRVGIGVREASDARILDCRIAGNYPAGSWTGEETGHFGVTYDPGPSGGNFTLSGSTIKGCVQGIFVGDFGAASSTGGVVISGNIFEGCHNHGVYAYGGVGNLISANTFQECSYPIAALGAGVIITDNMLYTRTSGGNLNLTSIGIREAVGCIVSKNKIVGDAAVGGVIIDLMNIVTNKTANNIISDNIIDVVGGSSILIRVGSPSVTEINENNKVSGNIVKGNGSGFSGVIYINNKIGFVGKNNQIDGNTATITGDSYGIVLEEQKAATVTGNKIVVEYNAAAAKVPGLFKTAGVVDTTFAGNQCYSSSSFGANLAYRVFWGGAGDARNKFENNKILLDATMATSISATVNVAAASIKGNLFKSSDPLSGSVTLTTAGPSVTVNNGNVMGQNVTFRPTNPNAANTVASQGVYVSVVDGVSFTLSTGTGAPPLADSSFSYVID